MSFFLSIEFQIDACVWLSFGHQKRGVKRKEGLSEPKTRLMNKGFEALRDFIRNEGQLGLGKNNYDDPLILLKYICPITQRENGMSHPIQSDYYLYLVFLSLKPLLLLAFSINYTHHLPFSLFLSLSLIYCAAILAY